MLHRREVLDRIRGAGAAGVTRRQLVAHFGERGPEAEAAVLAALGELEAGGDVVKGAAAHLVAVEFTDYHVGTVRMTSRGVALVRGEERDTEPVVVPAQALKTAMDGDLVLVHRAVVRRKGRREPEAAGEVVRILRRRRPTLVGRWHVREGVAWVTPVARRVNDEVAVERPAKGSPREGEFVEVAVEAHDPAGTMRGRLVRRIGLPDEPGTDEDVVLAEAGIPIEFPPAALAEAAALPESVRAADVLGRVDRRDQPAVTIDGETARDFDDAVVAFPGAGGAIEVFVHIADVSHYVTAGSALDAAARERGTSVYLPARCVPMLPEKLSNTLCSLVPEEDRLAFSVRFLVLRNGAVEGARAERCVFRSRRRCTYTEVFAWLDGGSWPADLPTGVRGSLELLAEAARRLGERRHGRGSIDFDLPEPEILLDPAGFMTGIQAAERTVAHRLIEELMVAANECVARLLTWQRQPSVFRVHDKPPAGKLAELDAVLREFGLELKGDLDDVRPRVLQGVLEAIRGRPEERLLQTLTLRALARAAYGAECKGHYALATEFYLHFTSPIRRYPDLVVHRTLAAALAGRTPAGVERKLLAWEMEEIAAHSSLTERRAGDAEREIVRWKQARFMRERIGEEFDGHVVGVTAFGVFVQLDTIFVEGLLHVSELKDDFYRYDEGGHRLVGERRGRAIRLGDAQRVRVAAVDEEHMEVRLAPADAPKAAPTRDAVRVQRAEKPARPRSGAGRRRRRR